MAPTSFSFTFTNSNSAPESEYPNSLIPILQFTLDLIIPLNPEQTHKKLAYVLQNPQKQTSSFNKRNLPQHSSFSEGLGIFEIEQ